MNWLVAFSAILAVLTGLLLIIATRILQALKASENRSESVQVARYQQAVTTPKDLRPKLPAKKSKEDDLVELSDIDFETAYEGISAHGRGDI